MLGLAARRIKRTPACWSSSGHSLSEYLLWNSDLDVNVVITIAIAINPGDAFPSQANLLVCLNASRDLLRKKFADVSWSPLSKNKTSHYTKIILSGIFKKGLPSGVQNKPHSCRPAEN